VQILCRRRAASKINWLFSKHSSSYSSIAPTTALCCARWHAKHAHNGYTTFKPSSSNSSSSTGSSVAWAAVLGVTAYNLTPTLLPVCVLCAFQQLPPVLGGHSSSSSNVSSSCCCSPAGVSVLVIAAAYALLWQVKIVTC
jgi:hypothetical protein